MRTAAEQLKLAALAGEIQGLEVQVQALGAFFKANALLRFDDDYGTYSKGYMVGVMVCLCKSKRLAACSGLAPPAFTAAVSSAGFGCASPPVGTPRSTVGNKDANDAKAQWACAAKQIMEKHGGHKPKQLIERWFSPMVKGLKHPKALPITRRSPKIVFEALVEDPQTRKLTLEKEYPKDDFKTGENVPMYCDTRCG